MVSLQANAHIHLPPNFSAFESAAQAVSAASAEGVRVLGANNYYDYAVYTEFAGLCADHGVAPLFGTEIICMIDELRDSGVRINDPVNPGKMYLCGKGMSRFAPMSDSARNLMNTIRLNDSTRMSAMTARMTDCFCSAGLDVKLTEADVRDMVIARHGSPRDTVYLQERHVAQAFQERLFERYVDDRRKDALSVLFGSGANSDTNDAVSVQNELRANLMKAGKPAFVPESFVGFDHAYNLILELGGIPCYPILADGANPVCEYEQDLDTLVTSTLDRNIHSCELIPVRNSQEQVDRYATSMRRAGLIVTAGTEHNTRDLIPIAPTCAGSAPLPNHVRDIFWEGACVTAAHQFLCEQGRPGYVDSDGKLTRGYVSQEARIAELSRTGEGIIRERTGT